MLKGLFSKIASSVGVDTTPDPHTADTLTADNADWGLVYNDSALRIQRGPKSFGKHLLTSSSPKALEAVADKLKRVKTSTKNSPNHSSPRPFVNPWRLDASTSPATGCFTYPPAGISDEDDRVRFRAVLACTSHGGGSGCLASARLVAYDSVRQLGVALVDGASVTVGTQGRAAPRHGGGGGVEGPSCGGYRNGACVYLFGYGGIPMDASACGSNTFSNTTTCLPHPTAVQTIPLPEMCCNEYWLDISISPGSHSIVLLGRDGICIIDASSVAVVMPTTTSSLSSHASALNKKGETVFDVRYIEKPPLVTSTNALTLDYCFSKLCQDMPLALPYTAAGTTSGRVLFAPLHPHYPDAGTSSSVHTRPQYWSQYEANLTQMLDTSGITTLIEKRRAEARVARQERMSMGGQFSHGAVNGPQQFTPRDLSPLEVMSLDMDDEVMALSSYPSDPNAFIASTRNSWGVVKWYVIEDRLSAMFLLPNVMGPCLADCEDGGSPVAPIRARRVYVSACKVTAGGGYVIGLTNLMTIFTWNEQNYKGKDKGVPALSRVDLLQEIPSAGIKHIDPAAMTTAASSSPQGILMNGASSSLSDWAMLDSVSTSLCRDVLVTSPEHLFLDALYPSAQTAGGSVASAQSSSQQLKSVGNAAHAIISESANNDQRRSQPGSPLSSQQQSSSASAAASEASLVSITVPVRAVRVGDRDTHHTVLYRIVVDCEQRKLQQAPGTVGVVSVMPLLGTATIMTPSSLSPECIDACGTPLDGNGGATSLSNCNGCLGGGEKERLLREGWRCRTCIVPMHPNTPWPGDPRGVSAMVPSQEDGANTNNASAPLFIGAYMCAISHETVELMSVPAAFASKSSKSSGNDVSSSAAADAMFKRYRVSRVICESPTLSTLSDYHNGSIADFSGLHCALLTTSASSSSPALQVQTSVWPIGPSFSSSTPPTNLPSFSAISKNTLTIVRCHHRRLMFDKVNHLLEALQSPLTVDGHAIQGSMLCNGLLQGGSTVSSHTRKSCNPFAVDSTVSGMAASRVQAVNPRTGRAMQKLRPYVAAEADDSGYFLLHHPPSPSSTSSSLSRIYPYAGEQAITSSTGSLIGCAMLPPPPTSASSLVPTSSSVTTTRTTLFSSSILGDSVTISLIRASILVKGKHPTETSSSDPVRDDDGLQSSSEQHEELYYVRVVSQRLLGADEDSDGDNDDGYSSADLADTYHPTLGPNVMLRRRFDSSAVSSGEFAVPVSEILLPKYCPMMCHQQRSSSSSSPTIRTARLLQGSCDSFATLSNATSRNTTTVPFQSLSGVSVAFVMSDNTVVISSVADLVRAHEYVWGVGDRAVLREAITPSTVPMPQTTHIPVFLFPAGLETTSIDFFTVPMISPSSQSGGGGSVTTDGNASMLILVAAMSSSTLQTTSHPGQGGSGGSGGAGGGASLFVINVTTQAVVACRRIPSESPHTTINDLMLGTPANGHHSYLYREDGGDMSMNRSDPTFMPSALREAFQSLVPAILATKTPVSSNVNNGMSRLYSTLSLLSPVSDPSHPLKEVCYHETLVSAGKSIPIVCSEVCLERTKCGGGNDVLGGVRVYNASIASYPQISSTFPPQLPFTPSQPPPFTTAKSRLSSPSPQGASRDPVSIGGATYVTLEVSLSGNMLTFSDLKDRYINAVNRNNSASPSLSSYPHSMIEAVLNVSMVDVFGMPILGVDVGVGPSSVAAGTSSPTATLKDSAPLPPQQESSPSPPQISSSSIPDQANTSIYIRVSDASLMMGGSMDVVDGMVGSWTKVPVSAEQSYAGVSLTRCLVSGVANITLTPVAFMLGGGDVPSPLSISTASSQHARPISTELFGLCPRISGITIGTMDLTPASTSSPPTGRRRCVIFSEEVSAEVIDGYDDSVRLLDVAPLVSSVGGGGLDGGGNGNVFASSGLTPAGEGISHMQLASYGRGAYCPHSFAPSASALNTLIYASSTCGSVVVVDDADKPTISLLTQLAEMSTKSGSNTSDNMATVNQVQCKILDIYSKACYPVAFGVATTRSSPHSPHGQACFFNAVLRDCLDTVVSSLISSTSKQSPSSPNSSSPTPQQQPPGQIMGSSASAISIPCSSMSFTRLLSVATRHNNMGASDLCRWRFGDDSPLSIVDDGVWDLLATGSIKGAKSLKSSSSSKKKSSSPAGGGGKKYSLEERMERRRKGLPVGDEVDVKESRATTTQTLMKELSIDPDAVSRLENHTVARMCRGGADSSTLGKLSLKSDFVECGSGGIKLARVCPFSVFSLPSCISMFTCLSTSRSAHDTDEMIQVRLSAASNSSSTSLQQGRKKMQGDCDEEDGLTADRSPDPLATMLAPYYRLSGCIPFSRQRPLVFVAFTTATSPCIASEGSGVLDGEEDMYNNTALFPEEEEVAGGGEESSSSGKGQPADCGLNHHTRPGVVRQGGLFRSQIAVYDVADTVSQASQLKGSAADAAAIGPRASTLQPQFIFPIPLSLIPPTHTVQGVAVVWVGGQAHCYISHNLPTSLNNAYVCRVVLDDGTRDIQEDIDSDLEMEPAAEEELQRAMPEKLAAVRRAQIKEQAARKAVPRYLYSEQYQRDCPTGVCLTQHGSGLRDPFRLHTCCPPYGVSKNGRREALIDAAIKASSSGGGSGTPWATRRILTEALPPPSGGTLSSTQKEQGFLKRLITTSYADQVAKVQAKGKIVEARQQLLYYIDPVSGVLQVVKGVGGGTSTGKGDAHFDDFFATVESSRLRNMTPTEKKRALLEGASRQQRGGAGGRVGSGTMGGIGETKDIMNENKQLLNERGEKIGKLELMTADMAREAETFANLTEQLKRKQRSKWFF